MWAAYEAVKLNEGSVDELIAPRNKSNSTLNDACFFDSVNAGTVVDDVTRKHILFFSANQKANVDVTLSRSLFWCVDLFTRNKIKSKKKVEEKTRGLHICEDDPQPKEFGVTNLNIWQRHCQVETMGEQRNRKSGFNLHFILVCDVTELRISSWFHCINRSGMLNNISPLDCPRKGCRAIPGDTC